MRHPWLPFSHHPGLKDMLPLPLKCQIITYLYHGINGHLVINQRIIQVESMRAVLFVVCTFARRSAMFFKLGKHFFKFSSPCYPWLQLKKRSRLCCYRSAVLSSVTSLLSVCSGLCLVKLGNKFL